MWDFLGFIIDQLGQTFQWFLTGFFLMIVILILLYKNNLLSNTGPLSFIKKISYYLFFPLYVGIICWFFSATLIVEKEAKELARITIEKAQNSIFPQFSSYILSLADNWIEIEFDSKEELVASYLQKYDFKEGDYSTKAMQWTLVNGLEYIQNRAIENGSLQLGNEKVNFPKLISNYLNGNNDTTPFGFLAVMSLKTISNYARSFYLTFILMGLVIVIILSIDVFLNLKAKKNNQEAPNFVNPSTTLENKQKKLENSIKEIEETAKIE